MNEALSMLEALSTGATTPRQQNQIVEIVAPTSQATCAPIKPTKSNNIDLGNLTQSNPDVWECTITNEEVVTTDMLLGCGILGALPGFGIDFGLDNLTISRAGCIDEWGVANKKAGFFNGMIAGASVLVARINVTTTDADQFAQSLKSISITPNGDVFKAKQAFTKIDTNLNYATLDSCVLPLSFYQGIIYPILPGKTVTISVEILGFDAIGNFASKLVH